MSSFLSVKICTVCFYRWLQLKHQSCPGSTSFHLLCSLSPPSLIWDVCWDERDRQTESSSDGVHHSRLTSYGQKLDVNFFFFFFFFSAPHSVLFESVSIRVKAYPAVAAHPLQTLHDITQLCLPLGLPGWSPNMSTYTERACHLLDQSHLLFGWWARDWSERG